uniref:RING-type domain-containing protein n=1 Tax=Globodera rostochiensis TaxID=31243 RepID=A0A914GUI2_GLORO
MKFKICGKLVDLQPNFMNAAKENCIKESKKILVLEVRPTRFLLYSVRGSFPSTVLGIQTVEMGQKESRNAVVNWALIKREELDDKIQELNKKCANCFEESSLNMLFVMKSSDEKGLLWQRSARIHCFTVLDEKIYRKTYNLYQFLKFYESFIQVLEASEASNDQKTSENGHNLLNLSIYNDSCCGCTEDGKCIICFDSRPDSVLPCAHAYCSQCIDAFHAVDQNCCPLCRYPLKRHGQDEAWETGSDSEID